MEGTGFIIEVMRECQFKLTMMLSGESTEFTLNFSSGGTGCDSCPIGEKTTSETDCTCVAIETLPAQGMLFEAHHYDANSVHNIEIMVNEMVTFRQFAVDGQFKYINNNFDDIPVCMSMVEEHGHMGEFYGQAVFKAEAPDCTWSLVFTTEDGSESLTFDISVKSDTGPIDVPFDTEVTELSFTVGQ